MASKKIGMKVEVEYLGSLVGNGELVNVKVNGKHLFNNKLDREFEQELRTLVAKYQSKALSEGRGF